MHQKYTDYINLITVKYFVVFSIESIYFKALIKYIFVKMKSRFEQ